MGVTVDVQQVYKYPFEQVVASFLRKVPARSSPAGLAFSRAASAGPAVCAPSSALLLLSSLISLFFLLFSLRISPHPPPLPSSCRCRLRDVLDEGGGGVPRRLPIWGEAKAPCWASRPHVAGESQGTQVLGPCRSFWYIRDPRKTSGAIEAIILIYSALSFYGFPAFSFIKQL